MDSVLKTGIVLREAIDSENEIISPSSSSFRIMHDEQASTSGKGYLDWLEESDEDDDGAAKLAKNDPKGEANAGSGNKEKLGSQREYQYGECSNVCLVFTGFLYSYSDRQPVDFIDNSLGQ